MIKPSQFKVGDIVIMKGWKVPMTINEIRTDGIECMWFVEGGKLLRDFFSPAVLQEAS
jgi:uncharacterized protein YodC (DUF2158 family)